MLVQDLLDLDARGFPARRAAIEATVRREGRDQSARTGLPTSRSGCPGQQLYETGFQDAFLPNKSALAFDRAAARLMRPHGCLF